MIATCEMTKTISAELAEAQSTIRELEIKLAHLETTAKESSAKLKEQTDVIVAAGEQIATLTDAQAKSTEYFNQSTVQIQSLQATIDSLTEQNEKLKLGAGEELAKVGVPAIENVGTAVIKPTSADLWAEYHQIKDLRKQREFYLAHEKEMSA